jgi:DNA-binding XRE family transcriptional regulator
MPNPTLYFSKSSGWVCENSNSVLFVKSFSIFGKLFSIAFNNSIEISPFLIVPNGTIYNDIITPHGTIVNGKRWCSMYFQRIKDLRQDADKTQQQIADAIHCNVTVYARYERGDREIPFSIAILLAKYYNVSLDYIAGIKNKP